MSQLEDLPNESVRQTLEQLLGHSDYKLELACARGDNYLGVLWRLQLPEQQPSLVLKLPPQNAIRRKQFFARACFEREILAYEQFLPLLQRYQEQQSVPASECFEHYACCLLTRQDEPNECLVLEDLCQAGYQLHSRFEPLTPAHVRLVMRAYAKLHASSLALKQQQPSVLQHYQQLVDIFEQRREDAALASYLEELKQSALATLCPRQHGTQLQRLQNYFQRGSYPELLRTLLSGSNCEPYAVVCHGDGWNNNFLYSYNKSKQRDQEEQQPCPLEVRLVDWQLMRYASPITDLVYFLFCCTTRDFRQQHYQQMLQLYYAELSQQLVRLGVQADQLLPRSAFEQQLLDKGAAGLLFAMMVLPIVTLSAAQAPDLQAISELIEGGATTNLQGAGFLASSNELCYKQRMRDVILDCVDLNYI
ncbi:CG2004 [Drosophila busckii]|uniref:CG2004 n=1 Tax=Drosophila busckii TaxID=30019 RepID=A0A0M3QZN7_DROBS|nr:uncharacterized protein LOC108607251 [Drosophila busckii]ALC49699.1 CG2004 [Drosophila busckii]